MAEWKVRSISDCGRRRRLQAMSAAAAAQPLMCPILIWKIAFLLSDSLSLSIQKHEENALNIVCSR